MTTLTNKIRDEVRTKLLVDFPEYEKYLPAIEVKKLPALIPSEARAKLSALGIPACAK